MGLTIWKDAPDGKVLKRDIGIAKNYLNEKEYEAFCEKQDKEYISEFDREVERYLKGE